MEKEALGLVSKQGEWKEGVRAESRRLYSEGGCRMSTTHPNHTYSFSVMVAAVNVNSGPQPISSFLLRLVYRVATSFNQSPKTSRSQRVPGRRSRAQSVNQRARPVMLETRSATPNTNTIPNEALYIAVLASL